MLYVVFVDYVVVDCCEIRIGWCLMCFFIVCFVLFGVFVVMFGVVFDCILVFCLFFVLCEW